MFLGGDSKKVWFFSLKPEIDVVGLGVLWPACGKSFIYNFTELYTTGIAAILDLVFGDLVLFFFSQMSFVQVRMHLLRGTRQFTTGTRQFTTET